MQINLRMKFSTVFLLLIGVLVNSQTKIKLAKNPYSDDFHGIVMLNAYPSNSDRTFYDAKSKKIKHAWKEVKIDVTEFKSLLIEGKGNSYTVTLQLDADGILQLDKNTTDNNDEILALVFNDTIYQTKRIDKPMLDGRFQIRNLTKKQKNNMVTTYKKLPSYNLQKKLYSAIQSGKLEKIDSLLNKGAQLIDGGYKIGYNNFRNVIYDLFRSKNSKYEKYPKTVNHLLKKGFVPKPKNLRQAIVFEDVTYVRNFFMSEKNIEKRKKRVRKKLKQIIDNGSLELLKLTEELGLDLEKITFGKNTVLMQAILKGDDEMIAYLLTKNISYDAPYLLVYTTIYNEIKTLDVLLNNGIDINTRFKDNSNIAQALLDLEFKHDGFMDNVSLEKIPQLIARGLQVNTINTSGNETVLHTLAPYVKKYLGFGRGAYATYSPTKVSKDVIAVVELLKQKGVDTKVKDKKGFTAYDYVLKDAKEFKINDKKIVEQVVNAFK